MSPAFFVIAGEPSGDRLGASLMAGLRQLAPGASFQGIGGPLMQAQGLESLFPMEELSVMGLAEVLPRLRALLARRDQAAAAALASGAAALITIDSPDFCLRVAAKVKAARPGMPTIHYVAPSVWAWRPKRAGRMARHIDHVLALLPFEPPFMREAGMSCDFVGHPVVSDPVPGRAEAAAFRAARGIAPEAPLLCVLPGSRRGEVSRLAPIFGATLARVLAARPEVRVVVPAAPSVAEAVAAAVEGWPGRPVLVDPRGRAPEAAEAEKRLAFRAADLALAASGTVSLELAAVATPMVIAYDMNWLSRYVILALLKTDTLTLVNLVSETRAVPEFIGDACRPAPIAAALLELIGDGAARAAQLAAAETTMQRLGRGAEPPGLRAAASVLAAIG
jgi:lipid-A-disaccharide synthase